MFGVWIVCVYVGGRWSTVLCREALVPSLTSTVYLRAYSKSREAHEPPRINLDGGGCGRCAADTAPRRCTGLRGSTSRTARWSILMPLLPFTDVIGAWVWDVCIEGRYPCALADGRFAAKLERRFFLTTFLSVPYFGDQTIRLA